MKTRKEITNLDIKTIFKNVFIDVSYVVADFFKVTLVVSPNEALKRRNENNTTYSPPFVYKWSLLKVTE